MEEHLINLTRKQQKLAPLYVDLFSRACRKQFLLIGVRDKRSCFPVNARKATRNWSMSNLILVRVLLQWNPFVLFLLHFFWFE